MNSRRILLILGLLAAGLIVLLNLGPAGQLLDLAQDLSWPILATVIGVQLLSYYFQAKFHQSFLGIFSYAVATRRLLELSIAINFTDLALPSFGLSGASLLAAGLRDQVPAGKSVLAHLFRYFFIYLTFPVILLMGFLMLLFGGGISGWGAHVILALVMGIMAGTVVAIPLLGRRRLVTRLVHAVVQALNRLARRWGRSELVTVAVVDNFLDEFYQGYQELLQRKRQWWRPLFWALAINYAEVATVFIVFLAFGTVVNFGAVVVGYALANMLSQIGFITGGLIVYEGVMIGTYVGLGIPWPLATAVVVVYRFISLFLFLPPGLWFYRKYI